jgi:UDP-N-acetylglucosamine 2-epimerase (non-hydrolysing)
MIRVLCVVGTRPEAIKMAPVLRALEAESNSKRIRPLLCTSGQHRELLAQVLDLFALRPDFALDVMRPGQSLAALTARLFAGLDRVLARARPDWVLAQGDTTTAFVAAVSAFYHGARFGHVEAGLRSGEKRRPFPEELNRRLAGVAADLHCAPTERARQALLREGVPAADIAVTGNPVVDAVRAVARRPYDLSGGPLAPLPRERRWVVVTAHRRESFGAPLLGLCRAVRALARRFAGAVEIVWPVHPNPQVLGPVRDRLAGLPHVHLLEPLDYAAMVHLLLRSSLVLTDSGGLQEEAPSLGVPVLVLREVTERPEGLETGLVELVGTDPRRVVAAATRRLRDPRPQTGMLPDSPYGDGRAAERIVAELLARTRSTTPRRKPVPAP